MRSALILLFCGLLAGAASTTSACSSDDEAGTLSGIGVGSGGDGGNMCPTDNCGQCAAGQTCCNGICADLATDLINCGQCCKSCPNPNPICELRAGDTVADCYHAECNKTTNDCLDGQFCCDLACCTVGDLCCPNGDGTYGCAVAQNGRCPQ